jgi:hypothetical protein
LTGQEKTGPRDELFYFSDEGDLMALRYKNWKVQFLVQDQAGTMAIWQRKFRGTSMPYIFNLLTDPYELLPSPRTPTGIGTSTIAPDGGR